MWQEHIILCELYEISTIFLRIAISSFNLIITANSNNNIIECLLCAKPCSKNFTDVYSFIFATTLKVKCYNHLHFIV